MNNKNITKVGTLPMLILLLQNISIFFYDIVKVITLVQLLCLIFYTFYFIVENKRIHIHGAVQLWCIYVFNVLFNVLVGGDFLFIVAFFIINLSMLFVLNIENFNLLEYKIIKYFTLIHLLGNIFIFLLPPYIVEPILQLLLGDGYSVNYSWRAVSFMNAGLTSQPGMNAIFLTILSIVCMVELIETGKKKTWNYILLALSIVFVLSTGKRSSVVAIPLVALFYLLSLHARKLRHLSVKAWCLIGMVLTGLVYCFVYLYNNSTLFDVLIEKTEKLSVEGNISNGRTELWTVALQTFESSPLFGAGLKSIYKSIGVDVHNTYLQILAETGLLGFLIFSIALANLYSSGRRIAKRYISIGDGETKLTIGTGFAIMLYMILYGFVGNTFIDYLPLMLFSVSIMMIFSMSIYTNNNKVK